MKGSVNFDPNNAKFTQKIHECTGCVNTVAIFDRNRCRFGCKIHENGPGSYEIAQKIFEIGQDFSLEFSFVPIKLPVPVGEFIYLPANVCM